MNYRTLSDAISMATYWTHILELNNGEFCLAKLTDKAWITEDGQRPFCATSNIKTAYPLNLYTSLTQK